MDASRRTVQAPADLPVSGRFLLSNPSSALPEFRCAICGGSAYTIERRTTPSGFAFLDFLFELRPFEKFCGMGVLDDSCDVYVCAACAGKTSEAFAAVREALVSELLFAAKDVAAMQFRRGRKGGREGVYCTECRMEQSSPKYLNHTKSCRTGRVKRLLEALMQLEDPAAPKRCRTFSPDVPLTGAQIEVMRKAWDAQASGGDPSAAGAQIGGSL